LEQRLELAKILMNSAQKTITNTQQVVDNLVSNAINFTNKGNIIVSCFRGKEDANGKSDDLDKESVVVEIRDTGA
jgi:signal transduction histidine kinase